MNDMATVLSHHGWTRRAVVGGTDVYGHEKHPDSSIAVTGDNWHHHARAGSRSNTGHESLRAHLKSFHSGELNDALAAYPRKSSTTDAGRAASFALQREENSQHAEGKEAKVEVRDTFYQPGDNTHLMTMAPPILGRQIQLRPEYQQTTQHAEEEVPSRIQSHAGALYEHGYSMIPGSRGAFHREDGGESHTVRTYGSGAWSHISTDGRKGSGQGHHSLYKYLKTLHGGKAGDEV